MLKYFLFFIFINKIFGNSDVYFTKYINSSSLLNLFKILNADLKGNIGIKVHTGEHGGKYYLTPNFLYGIYNKTDKMRNDTYSKYIECNAAYWGNRTNTSDHEKLLKNHLWISDIAETVIMDNDSEKDFNLSVNLSKDEIYTMKVGENLKDFKSSIVISHFKGNSITGFGGALKHLSIGFASQRGKALIFTEGKSENWKEIPYGNLTDKIYIEMSKAAKVIYEYFKNGYTIEKEGKNITYGGGGIAFINVLANISLKCDCFGDKAPDPNISDIGIVASTDPVALDKACINLIKEKDNKTEGKDEFLEQVNKLNGMTIFKYTKKYNIGIEEYNLIDIDNERKTVWGLILFLCIIFGSIIIAGILAYCFTNKSKKAKDDKSASLAEQKEE